MSGWIGVDFDGTLVKYESNHGPEDCGEPIPAMVDRVKHWLAEGIEVRIVTARVAPTPINARTIANTISHTFKYDGVMLTPEEARERTEWWNSQIPQITAAIEKWCLKHLGQVIPVTCSKDFGMIALYDDRAIQVEVNTGRLIGIEDGQEAWLNRG